ncbi:MAG: hypothetical protein EOP07_15490 [Proteobacteria bacterium]|nr:MAG: hypothetical protein EOP07_15490 [Pseudomonadota bacterium]
MRNIKRLLAFFAFTLCLISCGKKGSVNELYKFPDTKDVLVLVNIDFTADANTNGGIDLSGKNFVLNAYALDAADKQVDIGMTNGTPVTNLPVTLTGAHTSFQAVLRLPVDVQPRANGYALRFELKQPSASLVLATPASSLDALRSEIKAGTAASANNVDLSLASSLAYKFLQGSVANVGTSPALGSYSELVALFKTKQQTVEAGVDSGTSHDLDSYVSAILAGVNYQILTDSTFQKVVAEKLLAAATTEGTDAQKVLASEKLAEGFTSTLITLTSQVAAALSDSSSAISKVFNANFIDTASLPEPAAYANAVFAPLALAFSDTDSSAALAGDVVISAPLLATGVASYNVYFGAEDKASSKTLLAGNVSATKSPLSLTLPTGTAQPAGATRFWVYPVSNGVELNIPASIAITNIGGTNLAPQTPTGLAASNAGSTNSVTWNLVSGAQSYNLYWSTTSPVRSNSNRIKSVSSPYSHKGLLSGSPYYYAVTAVTAGVESALSSEAQTQSAPTGPLPGAFSITSATGGAQKVSLVWASSLNAAAYTVMRGTSSGTYPTTVASNVTSTNFEDKRLQVGRTYYYQVIAKNSNGSINSTAEISARTTWNILQFDTTSGESFITSSVTDSEGNLYVTGMSTQQLNSTVKISPTNSADCFVAKYSPEREKLWLQSYGSVGGCDSPHIAVDSQKNIYVAGTITQDLEIPHASSTTPIPSQAGTGYIIKFRPDQSVEWVDVRGEGNKQYEIRAIAISPSDKIMVGIWTNNTTVNGQGAIGSFDAVAVQYDTAGTIQWTRRIGAATRNTYMEGVTFDIAGAPHMVGSTMGALPGNTLHGNEDGFVAKLSASGTVSWINQFGGAGGNDQVLPSGIAALPSGGVSIAGAVYGTIPGETPVGGDDYFIGKISESGSFVWLKQSGNIDGGWMRGISSGIDGSIYMVGEVWGDIDGQLAYGNTSACIIKYSDSGTRQWTKLLADPNGESSAIDAFGDSNGDLIVFGTSTIGFDGNPTPLGEQLYLGKFNSDGDH